MPHTLCFIFTTVIVLERSESYMPSVLAVIMRPISACLYCFDEVALASRLHTTACSPCNLPIVRCLA